MNLTNSKFEEIEKKYDSGITRDGTTIISRITLDKNITYYIDENKNVYEKIIGEYYIIKDPVIIDKVKEVLYRKRDKFAEIDEELKNEDNEIDETSENSENEEQDQ